MAETWDTTPATPPTPQRVQEPLMVPAPSPEIVAYLKRAGQEEIRGYSLKGGGRDFNLERTQDAAQQWLDAVETFRAR